MTFEEFSKDVVLPIEEICRQFYRENRDRLKIKNEELAVKNYISLCMSTVKLSRIKGFRAMSIRELSQESGLSLGALYYYVSSKDEIVWIVHELGHYLIMNLLLNRISETEDAEEKLRVAIRTHIFLSEIIPDWFYFYFMETKNLEIENRIVPMESEVWTEKLFVDILTQGSEQGIFRTDTIAHTGASIKALVQDWYLKRWRFVQRNVSVEEYADFVISLIESYVMLKK